jgi:hypothetical protein
VISYDCDNAILRFNARTFETRIRLDLADSYQTVIGVQLDQDMIECAERPSALDERGFER